MNVLASGVPRHYGRAALRPFCIFPVLAMGRYVCVHIHDHVSLGVLKTNFRFLPVTPYLPNSYMN